MSEFMPAWLTVGASFADETGIKHGPRTVYHVRAIVDDHAVVRSWRKSKQRWEYEFLSEAFFWARTQKLKRL